MKRLYVPIAILLICAFMVAGCSSATSTTTSPAAAPATSAAAPASSAVPVKTSAAASGPQYGGTFIWLRNTGIPSIGAPPDVPTQTMTLSLTNPVLENLVHTDAQERIIPWLAESIDISTDGKTTTFHLLKGLKFQDGTPFNAEAVKFNLEKVVAANAASSSVLKKVVSYEIVDDYTLKVNFAKYDARFLLNLAQAGIGQIASPTAMSKVSNPQDIGKDHVIGTGPFKFDSWQSDQFIKMVKWDGYRTKGRPYLDAIEIRNNSDITVSIMSFKAGEVNMVENIDPADYVKLKEEGYQVGIPNLGFVFSILPDSANPDSPFKDVRVRQAMEYAIDKASMTAGIGKGTQWPAYQCAASPPLGNDPWYMADIAPREYNVAKAKQLLADAGYPNGFSYTLTSDVRIRQDMVVSIQTYLRAVGIETKLDMADVARAATFSKDGWKGILMPGFPNYSSFSSWVSAFSDPVMKQVSNYKPAGWREGWDEVAAEVDYDKRLAKMRDLLKVLYSEALTTPYLQDGPRYVIDKKIQDINWGGGHTNGFFDPVNIWIKK